MTTKNDNWIYERSEDNKARFVLGEKGTNPLFCIGINPSTAEPNKLDPTLRQVKRRSELMGYDGWIMLNLYPQRATNPNDLHEVSNSDYSKKNRESYDDLLILYPKQTIWVAWGNLIDARGFLRCTLCSLFDQYASWHNHGCMNIRWINIGNLTKKGNPHHPLYLSKKAMVQDFDILSYMKNNIWLNCDNCGNNQRQLKNGCYTNLNKKYQCYSI